MIIYIFLYLWIVLVGCVRMNKRTQIIVTSIPLFLVSGLRNSSIGADTSVYLSFFHSMVLAPGIDTIKTSHSMEIGFRYFTFYFAKLWPDSTAYLCFIALVVVVCFGMFVYKYSKDVTWSYLLYFSLFYSFYGLTGLRQSLAGMILLPASIYAEKRRIFPFLLLVLLATLFHNSALIFIIYYFLFFLKPSKRLIGIFFATFIVEFIFRTQVMNILTNIFVSVTRDDYYMAYAQGKFITLNYTILFTVITIAVCMYYKSINKADSHSLIEINSMILSEVILPTGLLRIAQYFSINLVLIMPKLLDAIGIRRWSSIDLILKIILLLLLVNTLYGNTPIYPYSFNW